MASAKDALKDILSGTVGGFAQVAVGHPLDTVKTRMQMQGQAGAEVYKGMADCIQKMFRAEGISGFYAGAFSPLAGAAFHNASLFLWWGALLLRVLFCCCAALRRACVTLRQLQRKPAVPCSARLLACTLTRLHTNTHAAPPLPSRLTPAPTRIGNSKRLFGGGLDSNGVEKRLSFSQYWMAGAVAAVPITVIEVPVDLLKVKLQAQGAGSSADKYDGVIDAAGQIWRKWGVRGLFQGGGATLLRNVPCFAGYFAGATHTKNLLTAPGEKSSVLASMAGGSVGGFLFWGIFYPLEMLKTRMQADALDPAERKYKSIPDCWNKTMAEGGWSAFYKGYTPCLARAVVVNSAIFGAFSMAKQYLA
jgi:hypothetical protein